MEHEGFDFFSDNPDAIQKHLDSGKAGCMVLNKNLPGRAIGRGTDYGYVLVNPYQGEERLVVAHGCYKNPVKRFDRPDPEILRRCSKTKIFMENDVYPVRVFKGVIEDPLALILMPTLTDKQLQAFKEGYETFQHEYENEMHTAIGCVYYDPTYKSEGGIIAQWYD